MNISQIIFANVLHNNLLLIENHVAAEIMNRDYTITREFLISQKFMLPCWHVQVFLNSIIKDASIEQPQNLAKCLIDASDDGSCRDLNEELAAATIVVVLAGEETISWKDASFFVDSAPNKIASGSSLLAS